MVHLVHCRDRGLGQSLVGWVSGVSRVTQPFSERLDVGLRREGAPNPTYMLMTGMQRERTYTEPRAAWPSVSGTRSAAG